MFKSLQCKNMRHDPPPHTTLLLLLFHPENEPKTRLWCLLISKFLKHCSFATTVSQHNSVTTQQCHNTAVSQHNSSQHSSVTTQQCHNTSVTTQQCHNTAVSQHNSVTKQQCHNTSVSQHNNVTTQQSHNSKYVIFQENLLKDFEVL